MFYSKAELVPAEMLGQELSTQIPIPHPLPYEAFPWMTVDANNQPVEVEVDKNGLVKVARKVAVKAFTEEPFETYKNGNDGLSEGQIAIIKWMNKDLGDIQALNTVASPMFRNGLDDMDTMHGYVDRAILPKRPPDLDNEKAHQRHNDRKDELLGSCPEDIADVEHMVGAPYYGRKANGW